MCPKPTRDRADNLFKLYVRKADGAYFCHRCGAKGSFYDLKRSLGDLPPGDAATVTPPPVPVTAATAAGGSVAIDTAFARDAAATLLDAATPHGVRVLQYMTRTRGIDAAVLAEYGVGAGTWRFPVDAPVVGAPTSYAVEDVVVFPWLAPAPTLPGMPPALAPLMATAPAASPGLAAASPWPYDVYGTMHSPLGPSDAVEAQATTPHSQPAADAPSPPSAWAWSWDSAALSRVKLRSLAAKSHQLLLPRGGGWGLFGLHAVPQSTTSLILTEGEIDALSVRSATGSYAASLPNGCRSLPLEVLPLLERFTRLYLWMDSDAPGREGAARMLTKLGRGRTFIVAPTRDHLLPARGAAGTTARSAVKQPPKDANEALMAGLDLHAIIAAAARQPHEEIVPLAHMRQAALAEVSSWLAYQRGETVAVYGADGRVRSAAGTRYRSFPKLNHLLKGHRAGEVTLMTGPTGSGKTTLLAQMSLDLAAQGVRTLWGSFEIKAPRLLATMVHQMASGRIAVTYSPTTKRNDEEPVVAISRGAATPATVPEAAPATAAVAASPTRGSTQATPPRHAGVTTLPDAERSLLYPGGVMDEAVAAPAVATEAAAPATDVSDASVAEGDGAMTEYETAATTLEGLPLQFLRFYGSTDVDRVLDALEYAVYVHDTEHIVLDNLQFMLAGASGSRGSGSFDRFDVQDRALDRFRAFATKHNVHVTLVIHPRKEAEDAPLGVASIFGSAKATQEADTVLILQRGVDGTKTLDVRKNRYDGSLGSIPLRFDSRYRIFIEADGVSAPGAPPAARRAPAVGASVRPAFVRGAGKAGGQNRGLHTSATAGMSAAKRKPLPTLPPADLAFDPFRALGIATPGMDLAVGAGAAPKARPRPPRSSGSPASSTRKAGGGSIAPADAAGAAKPAKRTPARSEAKSTAPADAAAPVVATPRRRRERAAAAPAAPLLAGMLSLDTPAVAFAAASDASAVMAADALAFGDAQPAAAKVPTPPAKRVWRGFRRLALTYSRSKVPTIAAEIEAALTGRWLPTVRERVWELPAPIKAEAVVSPPAGAEVA